MAQQSATQQPRPLTVIKASAGSGKTFTLAKYYIEQLLWDGSGRLRTFTRSRGGSYNSINHHEHILAITFTNAATDEMKKRIVDELYNLSHHGEPGVKSDYLDDFLKAHPGDGEDAIKATAHEAMKVILFNYTTFNVSTIDSFFQNILRSFTYELKKDNNYAVELDTSFATSVAVHNFLSSLGNGANASIQRWVEKYVSDAVTGNSSWNFMSDSGRNPLFTLARQITDEKFREHSSDIIAYLGDLGKNATTRLGAFRNELEKIITRCEQNLTWQLLRQQVMGFVTDNNLKPFKNRLFEKICNNPDGDVTDALRSIAGYVDKRTFATMFAGFGKKNPFPQVYDDDLITRLQPFVDSYRNLMAAQGIIRRIPMFGLLGLISAELERYRTEGNLIFLDDTKELIAKVVKAESDAPFMYERTGSWIDHYLIDEFQDTSRKQYENFKPLLGNSLSNGSGNLIIGDEKQSIYRFRNSDPDLLQSQLGADFTRYIFNDTLGTNYRSCDNVINFNNIMFANYTHNGNSAKTQKTYANVWQGTNERYTLKDASGKPCGATKGYVRINIVPKPQRPNPGEPDDGTTGGSKLASVLEALPQYLLDIKEQNKFGWHDMMVLVNTKAEGQAVVERLLLENQVRDEQWQAELRQNPQTPRPEMFTVTSAESLLLVNSAAVRAIVSVLRQLAADEAVPAPAGATPTQAEEKMQKKLEKQQLTQAALQEFGKNLSGAGAADEVAVGTQLARAVASARQAQQSQAQPQSLMSELRKMLPGGSATDRKQITLVEIVDVIIRDLLAPCGLNQQGETPFLLAFQQFVADYIAQPNCEGTVAGFIAAWDRKKDALTIPGSSSDEAIQVMTIHKSKGLEKPCVVIPFANWPMVKDDGDLWVTRQQCDVTDPGSIFCGMRPDIIPPYFPYSKGTAKCIPGFASLIQASEEASYIDILNKTYVAFTRPRQALHVFAVMQEGSSSTTQFVGDEIVRLLGGEAIDEKGSLTGKKRTDELGMVHHDATDASFEYYELGDPLEQSHAHRKAQLQQQASASQGGSQPPLPEYSVASEFMNPPISLDLAQGGRLEAADWGTRVHRVLERLRDRNHLDKALSWARLRGVLPDTADAQHPLRTITGLRTVLENALEHNQQIASWFAPENTVLDERSILHPETDKNGRHSRIDRLVVTPDGRTIVVDYKTGEVQRAEHKLQVQGYMRLLADAGFGNIEGYLWYLGENAQASACGEVVPVELQ